MQKILEHLQHVAYFISIVTYISCHGKKAESLHAKSDVCMCVRVCDKKRMYNKKEDMGVCTARVC